MFAVGGIKKRINYVYFRKIIVGWNAYEQLNFNF
jgi:hypothetical protein